jgi:hypothetical protein
MADLQEQTMMGMAKSILIPIVFIYALCVGLAGCKGNTREIPEAPPETEETAVRDVPYTPPAIQYPRIENAFSHMETPEYFSFLFRYERIRDEQMPLLEESIQENGLSVDIKNSQPLNRAGYGLYEKKAYAEAVRFFREAAYIDPENKIIDEIRDGRYNGS